LICFCFVYKLFLAVLWSRSRKEPHHFGGAISGAKARAKAGAITGCGSGPGSGSDSSKLNVLLKWIIKNATKLNSFLLFPFIFETILIKQKSEEKEAPTLRLSLVCFGL
jgi:hypothetical protein